MHPKEEIAKLPDMIREKGWSCYPLREDGTFLQGASGPKDEKSILLITVYTGVPFNVTAREEDLKVRIAWPGQFSTSFTCDSAEQVVMWLSRMIAIAEKDIQDIRQRITHRTTEDNKT